MTDSVYLGGRWTPGTGRVSVVDPAAPDQVVGEYGTALPDQVGEACDSAAVAFADWSRRPPDTRLQMLDRVADLIEERSATLARLIVREEGKTLGEATGETRRSAAIFRYYAAEVLQPAGTVLPGATILSMARRVPRGVVAVVTSFNYPLLVPSWKIAPALAFGNAVVWKPASGATLAAIELCHILDEAGIPPGVVQLLPGRGSVLGPAIASHPAVDAITFTGSTEVGRTLERLSAGRGVALQLEMGGKNAAIVLDDADVSLATRRIAYGALSGTGQKCTAIERCIVDRRVADQLVDGLAEEFERWVVGPGLDSATKMGPLVDGRARDRVLAAVDAAVRAGASLVTGGPSPLADRTGGYFVRPTLLDGVAPEDEIALVEVFGPVLAVLRVDGAREAVAVHEATPYGLNAGVFTGRVDRALALADELTVGMMHVNDVSGFPHHAPFGGRKSSGHGPLELGKSAVSFLTEEQVVHVHHLPRLD